ncbi:uncharacterized protein SPPG_02100 [Spizellomyces punctatus DAOM BR117]|uniref:STB6-like N-terminal domain-containing protein n=1 Tax=Spizellomyces punctatus (strain DAOM BR117) TaxID=645134 RepID=A0A0L0HPZ4_SPIPD|nr:uncharacterized protein SPPG_02100 [Spizellomyces punctatus DAOM BR117]KND03030.1 hypothetical protein SPPG_02100 [Spizellomyces punctatus DAOM BR117]|eukprot:XP_016611069.1 hypothetical protein SPPG_02100 [Spizellomyces punctatus DAOM BR117]
MSRHFLSGERQTLTHLSQSGSNITVFNNCLALSGYQLYVNVDWVVNRGRIFNTFAVYTGRTEHVALFAVAEFSGDVGEEYDVKIQKAFAQLEVDRLQMRETGFGVVMVGNPEWFSKASSPCIPVPDGDYDAHLATLVLNINLRRFGCGERSLLSFRPPSQAVCEKFYRITGTQQSPQLPFDQCVLTVGRMVQQALVLLALLNAEYADGLMCNSTSAALKQFYNEFGPFNDVEIEPGNWCDPPLVTVVLRTVEGLKQKLGALGYAVKMGNELNGLARQIKHFQKSQGLRVTHVFDRKTINRIETLYVRVPAQAQAVAAVSSTVNVLRSKIEDITGFPTASHRRGDDSDGQGPIAGPGSNEHDLEYFLNSWIRVAKRTEKQQSRKKEKRTDNMNLTVPTAPSPNAQTPSPRMAGTSPISPTVATLPQPALPLRTDPLSATSTAPAPVNSSISAQPPPPGLPIDDLDEENQQHPKFRATPARMLRGLKDSTSRTLGGIVEKSKLVTKGMKQLAHTVKEAGGIHDEGVDGEADVSANAPESGNATRQVSTVIPSTQGHDVDVHDEARDLVENIVERSRPPVALTPADGLSGGKRASIHRRALSLDSVRRTEMNILEKLSKKRDGTTSRSGERTLGRHSIDFGSRATDLNDLAAPPLPPTSLSLRRRGTIEGAPSDRSRGGGESSAGVSPAVSPSPIAAPSSPISTSPIPPLSLALHPRLISQRAALIRRLHHLSHALGDTIPPLLKTLTTNTSYLSTHTETHITQTAALKSSITELQNRQKALVEKVEQVENEVLRVRYAVGVLEERVGEAEEAVLGFLGRLSGVEGWWRKKGGSARQKKDG